MSLHSLGTSSTTALQALTYNPAQGVGQAAASSILSAADLAAINNAISGDGHFAASNPTGILATGSTHSSTLLDTLVLVAGGPLSTIQIGALVLGVGIPAGTFVVAKPSATSVTLSQAATTTAAGVKIGIVNPLPNRGRLSFAGLMEIPGRGTLIVKPGDVVAIDNTGWPILISAASINYSGSLWSFV